VRGPEGEGSVVEVTRPGKKVLGGRWNGGDLPDRFLV